MRRMFTEFGLTPSARSRFNMPQTVDEPSLAEQLFTLISSEEEDHGD
jgi:phage terminase small subunit